MSREGTRSSRDWWDSPGTTHDQDDNPRHAYKSNARPGEEEALGYQSWGRSPENKAPSINPKKVAVHPGLHHLNVVTR